MRWFQAGAMVFGAVVYILAVAFTDQLNQGPIPWQLLIFVGWNVLLPIVAVVVIVDAVLKVRAKKTRVLATDVLTVKFASIPYFLVNFLVVLAITLVSLGLLIIGGFLFLPFLPLIVALTYVAMLSTSVYLWAAIVQLRRDRVIGTGLTVVYVLLSLIFVLDIAAGILLYGHSRGRPGRALVIVLLGTGVLLAVPGFLLSDWLDPFLQAFDIPVDGPPWVGIAGVAVLVGTVVGTIVWHVRRRRGDAGAEVEVLGS